MDRTHATAAATGRELGKSDVAVIKAAKAGRISRNADGTFDIDKVKLEWAANTSPIRGGARNEPHTPDRPATIASSPSARAAADNAAVSGSLLKARTMRESYEAQTAKLDYQEKAGQLIDRAGVEMAMETAFRLVRDAIMATPDRLPLPVDVCATLRNALRDTLADVEKTIQTTLVQEPVQ